MLASRMARAWLLPSSLPSAAARPLLCPLLASLMEVYSWVAFRLVSATTILAPLSVLTLSPPQPPTSLAPASRRIQPTSWPSAFPTLLTLPQWLQPFPSGEGRLGPWDLHGPGPSRCDPDSTGAQPHRGRADGSSLRADEGLLASLQGRRNSHRFAPSLPLPRAAA